MNSNYSLKKETTSKTDRSKTHISELSTYMPMPCSHPCCRWGIMRHNRTIKQKGREKRINHNARRNLEKSNVCIAKNAPSLEAKELGLLKYLTSKQKWEKLF